MMPVYFFAGVIVGMALSISAYVVRNALGSGLGAMFIYLSSVGLVVASFVLLISTSN